MLPGGWIVDPVADIRQAGTPRVWVHSAFENPIGVSLGFSRRGDAFYVLVRHHDEPEYIRREEVRYDNLSTALSRLATLLMMLHEEQRCHPRRQGRSADETAESAGTDTKQRVPPDH